MKELHLWNFIHTQLSKNYSVILTAVVAYEKGSPGKQGFKMAVSSNGNYVGSIGGGVMEFNILKKHKELLKKNIKINKIETLHHNKKPSSNKSGLICSGSQTNFTVTLLKKDLSKVTKILNAVKDFESGQIIFDNNGIYFKTGNKIISDFNFKYKNETDWKYKQSIGRKNIVYIIGGGHVGLAVSRLLSMLDFYVVVYDSRDDLQTMKGNKFADKIIICEYKNLGKTVKENSFIVIVTTGFESDKVALEQVINKNVKYIGLMGTRSKIKKIYNEAVKDGMKKDLLKKVHAPIGIDINSDTPEEIAISIAAEIIKVKNHSS